MQLINGCLQLYASDLDNIQGFMDTGLTTKEAMVSEFQHMAGISLNEVNEIGFTSDVMAQYPDLLTSIIDELRKMKSGAPNGKA